MNLRTSYYDIPLPRHTSLRFILMFLFASLAPNASGGVHLQELKVSILLPFKDKCQFHCEWDMGFALQAIKLTFDKVLATRLPGLTNITFYVSDTECSIVTAPLEALQLYRKYHFSVLFGPVCALALSHVVKYADLWRVPVITPGGTPSVYDDKREYPALTRISHSDGKFAKILVNVLRAYDWNLYGFIYDRLPSMCYYTLYAVWSVRREGFQAQIMHRDYELYLKEASKQVRTLRRRNRYFFLVSSPHGQGRYLPRAKFDQQQTAFDKKKKLRVSIVNEGVQLASCCAHLLFFTLTSPVTVAAAMFSFNLSCYSGL
ncbi:hypothetical protein Btru_070479 [Bulinus truncatus]|nr:hypothetical protein Btru_070479 [Bulinus truncatus]